MKDGIKEIPVAIFLRASEGTAAESDVFDAWYTTSPFDLSQQSTARSGNMIYLDNDSAIYQTLCIWTD